MALDMIQAIRTSEEQAAEIRQNAVSSARNRLKQAQEEGEAAVLKKEQEARREAAKILEDAEARIRELQAEEGKAEAEEKQETAARSEANLERAAEYVIGFLKKELQTS